MASGAQLLLVASERGGGAGYGIAARNVTGGALGIKRVHVFMARVIGMHHLRLYPSGTQ